MFRAIDPFTFRLWRGRTMESKPALTRPKINSHRLLIGYMDDTLTAEQDGGQAVPAKAKEDYVYS